MNSQVMISLIISSQRATATNSQGWLSPLHFHPIADDSEFCFLKGTCRPAQRINDAPHKLWICLANVMVIVSQHTTHAWLGCLKHVTIL